MRSNRVARMGEVIYRSERIGRVYKGKDRKWHAVHAARDFCPWEMPETFTRQCDAVLALQGYHRQWDT